MFHEQHCKYLYNYLSLPAQLPLFSCLISTLYRIYASLSGEPDYFGRNKISSGGDLSHYSSASLY